MLLTSWAAARTGASEPSSDSSWERKCRTGIVWVDGGYVFLVFFVFVRKGVQSGSKRWKKKTRSMGAESHHHRWSKKNFLPFPLLSSTLTVIPDGLRVRGATRAQQPRFVRERVQLVRGAVGDVGPRRDARVGADDDTSIEGDGDDGGPRVRGGRELGLAGRGRRAARRGGSAAPGAVHEQSSRERRGERDGGKEREKMNF